VRNRTPTASPSLYADAARRNDAARSTANDANDAEDDDRRRMRWLRGTIRGRDAGVVVVESEGEGIIV
jgi:hypothetical protein